MSRLDARIKTDLTGWILQSNGADQRVRISELSLNGLFLDGWSNEIPTPFQMNLPLAQNKDVQIFGKVVRTHNGHSAVQVYHPERETMENLWGYIKDKIPYPSTCPYCNHANIPHQDHCNYCGWYLNFYDHDYLDKHLRETFLQRINTRVCAISPGHLHRVMNFIDRELLSMSGFSLDQQFVGTSSAMLEVFSLIRKVARSEIPVLILGESGTGKDLTARAIHERGARARYPFAVINCTAIPENLLESELFGYEKGAFTGAYTSKKGKLELADGGTVFLDEIAELPLSLQAKLLRVLEDKTLERLGGKNIKNIDIRLISATSKNLADEVKTGKFRLDLFHRINTFIINLPPLRERDEDVALLAKYYLQKFCLLECATKHFSKKSMAAINSYSWPGNVRELINKVRKAIVVSEGSEITPADLSVDMQGEKAVPLLRELQSDLQKQKLIDVLQKTSHNLSETARLLGVSRPTIYALIKKYGLEQNM
jgi:transcriptional regulator of acetoin/glycerol metabolism